MLATVVAEWIFWILFCVIFSFNYSVRTNIYLSQILIMKQANLWMITMVNMQKNGQLPQAKPRMVALKVSSLKLGIARWTTSKRAPCDNQQRELSIDGEGRRTDTSRSAMARSRPCRASTAPSNRKYKKRFPYLRRHRSGIAVGKQVFFNFWIYQWSIVAKVRLEMTMMVLCLFLAKIFYKSHSKQRQISHFGRTACLCAVSAI